MELKKERDSNFELLRIVAIAGIVIHHFLIALGQTDYPSGQARGGDFINAFVVMGVNCFVLISGYYGIRLKAEKVFRLLFTIGCVVGIDYALYRLCPLFFNFGYAASTVVPFMRGSNWFITSYFGLMFVTPVLNRAIQNSTKRELRCGVACFSVPMFLGYFFNSGVLNANGYCCLHLMFVYLIGACLRNTTVPAGRKFFAAYAVCALAAFAVARVFKGGFTAFAYNSPQILLASVFFFLSFKNIKLQSRLINRLAGAVFTTFLLHYIVLQYVRSMRNTPLADHLPALALIYICIFAGGFLAHELINWLYGHVSLTVRITFPRKKR